MSQTITVQSVLDDAAVRWGDPNKSRFTDPGLLSIYNDAVEDMTTRWQLLEVDASFDWEAGEDRYSYPDGGDGVASCVQMLRLQYNDTPSDPNTWLKVYEKREDDYTARTDGNKPEGDQKLIYWPRTSFFVVSPVPETDVQAGGKIGYWKQGNRVSSITPSTLMELPTPLRTRVRDKMLEIMDISMGRTDEARDRTMRWEKAMDMVAARIENPVDDAGVQFRPARIEDEVNVT